MSSTRRNTSIFDLLSPLVSLLGLYLFITSFFLAKRSLPHASTCEEAAALLRDTLGLTPAEVKHLQDKKILSACWMERRVDSMVMVVVDALRFDFALHHLPKSVGARIATSSNTSRLLQFVADPPTVTMQRLKALTTGGLPTFADISGNMGGASVEEDTWLQQLKSADFSTRHLPSASKVAFVGDDTWLDLFPTLLDEAYPYPSFNTRDLDTVDNGCLHHIPGLLDKLRTRNATSEEALEVMIVHFLGVDHVGHTYGPHNVHMDQKLRQMDDALNDLLEYMDHEQESCSVAFIFGDHGMTEDGNHGGGSEEEINAALFAHFSPKCGVMTAFDGSEAGAATGDYAQTAFTSIHQIDLVPTISLLLGLPIPYANLGSLVPALALLDNSAQTATALALNAAQVWRYFTMYSSTANQLPGLDELEERLQKAVDVWKDGLAHPDGDDSTVYLKACGLFKTFLLEALELGQRVWTRFDTNGMALGAFVIFVGIVFGCIPLFHGPERTPLQAPPPGQVWELILTMLFVVFSCGILTFGNSYILEEEHVCMYMIAILGFVLSVRLASGAQSKPGSLQQYGPLIIPIASRLGELFVTGHGQDPSVRAHDAHHPAIFLSGIVALVAARWYLNHVHFTPSFAHMMVDCATLACLGQSWWEKRQPDPERHGFAGTRCAIALVLIGLLISLYQANLQQGQVVRPRNDTSGSGVAIIIKLMLLIMIVTGPSSASSMALFSAQASAIFVISRISGPDTVASGVLAALWRFIVRHVFFATNHGCTFSRLQLSAAFVATSTFNFVFAGSSLFINTFGWEIVGLCFAWMLSSSDAKNTKRFNLWRWYCIYQLIETLCSCVSVSVLRRHLMVWDIYAPHFLFVAIFMILFAAFQLLVCYFGYRASVR